MQASELRVNTLYKLTFPTAGGLMILEDNSTQITIVATDGDYDASTPDALLPFSGIDYLEYEGDGGFSVDDQGDHNNGRATDATYILYYITTLNVSDCATLAQYSEPCYMGNVIKITQSNYDILYSAFPNSATITTNAGDVTTTYDPNAIYLISGADSKKYRHNIEINFEKPSDMNREKYCFSFICGYSIPFTSSLSDFNSLCTMLKTLGFDSITHLCPAWGKRGAAYVNEFVIGVYGGYTSLTEDYILGIRSISLTELQGGLNNNTLTFYHEVHTSTSLAQDYSAAASSNCYIHDIVEEI